MMTSRSSKFCQKYKKVSLGFEIGVISQVLADKLSCQSTTVLMSDETIAKNLRNHSDLCEDDYLQLSEIVGKSNFIVKDRDRMIAVVLQSHKLYHYALKSTKTGEALFLTSFRMTNKISIEKIRKKFKQGKVEIIKDNLP